MNNDNIIIVISTVTLVTLIAIWAGLRFRKAEVDDVLTEQKVSESSQTSLQDVKAGSTENHDLTTSSPNNFQKPEMVQPIENLPIDKDVLIDYNILQNYSDYLGYWISQFDFVIDHISLPLFASVIGYTCVTKLYPAQLADYKPYAFVCSLITIPVNLKLDSIISQNIEDKKNIKELNNLFRESSKESSRETSEEGYFLAFLERELVFAMSDTSRKGRITQYRWIKEYVKEHQISEKSLFNVYLNVLNLKEYSGINSVKLSDSEAKLASAIRQMISYTYVFSDKKV